MTFKTKEAVRRRAGRPTQEEAARLTERILERALMSFVERGFSGTTIEKLADECGVTRRSVMQRFPSKDDLLVAVASIDTSRYGDQLAAMRIREATALADVKAVCRKLWERGQDPKEAALLRAYLGETGRIPRLAEYLAGFARQLVAYVANRVREAQRFGLFNAYSADTVGTFAVAVLISHPRIRTMLIDDHFEKTHALDAYFEEVWALIREMALR